jgi:hypothetical protein
VYQRHRPLTIVAVCRRSTTIYQLRTSAGTVEDESHRITPLPSRLIDFCSAYTRSICISSCRHQQLIHSRSAALRHCAMRMADSIACTWSRLNHCIALYSPWRAQSWSVLSTRCSCQASVRAKVKATLVKSLTPELGELVESSQCRHTDTHVRRRRSQPRHHFPSTSTRACS